MQRAREHDEKTMRHRVGSRARAAVAALLLAGGVSFAGAGDARAQSADAQFTSSVTVAADHDSSVALSKDVDVSKVLDLVGAITVSGEATAERHADSTVLGTQINRDNEMDIEGTPTIDDDPIENSVSLTGNVLESASGNIGLNASAGFTILQGNTLSLSALGAGSGAGSTDASVASHQESAANNLRFVPTDSSSALLESVLSGADGNIGVNLGAGAFNNQFNGVSIATLAGLTTLADARAATHQHSNTNAVDRSFATNEAGLGTGVLPNASGNMGINAASGASNLQNNSLSIAMVE